MTIDRTDRASVPARRVGYLVGFVVNAILLYLVNVRPGWRELSYLTDRTADVLPLVNLSLLVSVAVNLVYLAFDPAWFRSIGQIVVAATGPVAALRTLQVFPFDFSAYEFSWSTVTRGVLIVAVVGSALSIVVELAKLVTHASHASVGGDGARPRGAV